MALGKAIAIVAGIALGGAAAYTLTTDSCLLGSCGTKDAAAPAAAVSLAADAGKTECALCPSQAAEQTACAASTEACAEKMAASGCCSADKAVEVTQVAATEAAASGCCLGKPAAECPCNGACTGDCSDKQACTEGEKPAEQVVKND